MEMDGYPRRGYQLDNKTVLENKTKIIQDSVKEDYLLCAECENYLGVIEHLASPTFLNIEKDLKEKKIEIEEIKDVLDLIYFVNSNPIVIRLFVYSLFWRVSISNDSLFEEYKIKEPFQEELRAAILRYKSSKKWDLIHLTNSDHSISIFPFYMMTAKIFENSTSNVLFAPYSFDPYCLIVDRFSFMLFRAEEDMKIDFIRGLSNTHINDCRMARVSQELWQNLMVKMPFEKIIENAKANKE